MQSYLSFPVILLILLSLGSLSFYLSDASSINEVIPTCFLRGWPPRTALLLGYPIPLSPASDKIDYHGHYCYSGSKTKWCHRPLFSYKSFDNCTSEPLTDGVKVKCNMTEFLKKLYPNFWDSSLSSQLGNTVCMVISATNKISTNFTKKKCCNLRESYKFSAIEILSLTTPAKGQINVTWRSPSDMDDSSKGFTEYNFYLSMIDSYINKTIPVFPSKPKSSIFFHIIGDLEPYTKYRLTGSVFLNQESGIQSKPMEVRTLPEAPSAPPIIVENQVISQSETTRTVALKWMHPEKQKRNGIIMQTVMEYQKQTDNINETLMYYVKRIVNGSWTNATITDLIKDSDYVLTLQSCTTAVDCSIHSQQITLKGIGAQTQQPSHRSRPFTSSTGFILILVLILALVVGVPLLVCLVCYFKRRNPREDAVPEFPSPEDITVLPDDQTQDIEEREPDTNNAIYTELYPEKMAAHDQAAILQADDSAYLESNSSKQSQEEIPLC